MQNTWVSESLLLVSRFFFCCIEVHELSDTGEEKKRMCLDLGADYWIDFKESKDLVAEIKAATGGLGAHSAVVTTASVCSFLSTWSCPKLIALSISGWRIPTSGRLSPQKRDTYGCRSSGSSNFGCVDILHRFQGLEFFIRFRLELRFLSSIVHPNYRFLRW